MTPYEAQQRIAAINAEIIQHEQAILALTNEISQLTRIAEGFDNDDAHHREEMRRYQEKMASWDNGTHPWLQSQEATRQAAEEERQRQAEQARRRKQQADIEIERIRSISPG